MSQESQRRQRGAEQGQRNRRRGTVRGGELTTDFETRIADRQRGRSERTKKRHKKGRKGR